MMADPFAAVLPSGRGLPGALEHNGPLADDEMRRLTDRLARADFQAALVELNRARPRRTIPDRRDRLIQRIAAEQTKELFSDAKPQVWALLRAFGVQPASERRIISVDWVLHIWPQGDEMDHVLLCPRPRFLCGASASSEVCEHAVLGAWAEAKRFTDAGESRCARCESARAARPLDYPECDEPGFGSGGRPDEMVAPQRAAESAVREMLAHADFRRSVRLPSLRVDSEAAMWRGLDRWTVDAARQMGDRALAVMLTDLYAREAPRLCGAFDARGLSPLLGDAFWSRAREVAGDLRRSEIDLRRPAFGTVMRSVARIRLRELAATARRSRGQSAR